MRDELGLTTRERQILAHLALDKTNSEIASALWIAPATVRKHLQNIYLKLGVRTRAGAVGRFLAGRHDEQPARTQFGRRDGGIGALLLAVWP